MAVGTPMYMPPEVLAGGKADGQSDLYSLGVLLYECASGSRPFSGTSAEKVFMAILSGKYEPLKRKASGLPRGFLDIVERCMQRDPKKRFPNAAELHRALENLLESAGAAANHRARLVGFLHEKKKLTETEALTYLEPWEVVDLESAVSLDVPPPSLVRFLLAALSLSALCATYLWSTQGAGFFEAIARAARP